MPAAKKKPVKAEQKAEQKSDPTADRMTRLEDALIAIADRITSVPPVQLVHKDQYESTDFPVGQGAPRNMPSTGPARVDPMRIVPVDRVVSPEKMAALAFNEELITVIVADSTIPNDEPVIEVYVDRLQLFLRGREQTVKRKYVEALARAKITKYSQEKYKDENGVDSYREVPHTAPRYTFTVRHDPSPKAAAWLASVLASA